MHYLKGILVILDFGTIDMVVVLCIGCSERREVVVVAGFSFQEM